MRTFQGSLQYFGWENDWRLDESGKIDHNMKPFCLWTLNKLHNQRVWLEKDWERLHFSINPESGQKLYFNNGNPVLAPTDKLGYLSVPDLFDELLTRINGRNVTVTVDAREIALQATMADNDFSLFLIGDDDLCPLSLEREEISCRSSQETCLFLTAKGKECFCQKFNKLRALTLLDKMAKRQIPRQRIGNCTLSASYEKTRTKRPIAVNAQTQINRTLP